MQRIAEPRSRLGSSEKRIRVFTVGNCLPADRRAQARSGEPAATPQEANPADRTRASRRFGLQRRVLVDAELNVIAGHGRLLACGELGWSEVPTLRLDHLSPAQARAFMIADNRLTEISAWDDRLLAEQLKELSLRPRFQLDVTGFEIAEIDLRIEGLRHRPMPRTTPMLMPEPCAAPGHQLGDVWVLVPPRLMR